MGRRFWFLFSGIMCGIGGIVVGVIGFDTKSNIALVPTYLLLALALIFCIVSYRSPSPGDRE